MPGSSTGGLNFETVFHQTTIDLQIPTYSSIEHSQTDTEWYESIRDAPPRQTSFLDEKLFYVVVLSIAEDAFSTSSSEPPSDLSRFLSRLQFSMSAHLLPPLTARPPSLTLTAQTPNPNSLAPPETPHAPIPQTPETASSGYAPVTPMPRPDMDPKEDQYARVDGVLVWEGSVAELDKTGLKESKGEDERSGSGRVILKSDGKWVIVYKGQIPVVYVRTNIANPVLSLTASVTLRDAPIRKKSVNAETSSIFSNPDSVRTDGTEDVEGDEVEEEEEEDLAGMEEIDLLGGLSEEKMPTSRLSSTLRQDLSLPPVSPSSTAPPSAVTPAFAQPTPSTASSSISSTLSRARQAPHIAPMSLNTTLRKSYRRVLALSPGLRVRMRTLFLPQLLPPRSSLDRHEEEDEGERRVALCVEIENPIDSPAMPFEVESITVDVGGKGGKAQASLICQPEQCHSPSSPVFPLLLSPVDQYNLLYAVSIASTAEDRATSGYNEDLSKAMGRGDEQRPVAINIIGRPKGEQGEYPCETFSSRWNCTLDLGPFYAASANTSTSLPPPLKTSAKPFPTAQNAVAGDKRFSLSSLAASNQANRPLNQRVVSHPQRPNGINGQGGRVNSLRGGSFLSQGNNHGLLVSVKVLDNNSNDDPSSSKSTIAPLIPFSLEVYVHNRTEEVRRFRISIPPKENSDKAIRDLLAKRRKRRPDEPHWGVEDPILKQMLSSYLATAPALIPLEDDIRCGPLLPGASMSARVRFLAMREGVHTLEQIRLIGAAEEFDFVISPVLDIVVGNGVDHH